MGRSFGWQQFGAGSGMAIGAWGGGALFVLAGSYTLTILVSVGASLLGALIIFSMEPDNTVLIPSWEDSLPAEARSDFQVAPNSAGASAD